MRRNREPGTRNPLSCPESKQRMIVCWLTLHILAASPVVKTVFMVVCAPSCEIKDKVPPLPHHSEPARKKKTTLDRPPCIPCSRRELNRRPASPPRRIVPTSLSVTRRC